MPNPMSQSVPTIKDFVDLLRKSGLAEPAEIDKLTASLETLDAALTDEVTTAFTEGETQRLLSRTLQTA